MSAPDLAPAARCSQCFVTTHWSVVFEGKKWRFHAGCLRVGKVVPDLWRPLYTYIRREGYDVPTLKT